MATVSPNTAVDLCLEKLGIEFKLKDKQFECIEQILCGKDTLAILPTGYGKSLIYILLPLCLDYYNGVPEGTNKVMVLSPLVALMDDQMLKMNTFGISAIHVGSGEEAEYVTRLKSGDFQIVLLSPEAFFSDKWRAVLQIYRDAIKAIVVDEAHVIDDW